MVIVVTGYVRSLIARVRGNIKCDDTSQLE